MQVTVYDKAFKRKGTLGAPSSIDFDLIANGAGTATVSIPAGRPRVAEAMAPGARLVIEEPGMVKFSGKVISRGGSGPRGDLVTLTVQDDWRLFNNLRAWPVPTAAISAQGAAYRKYTGTAEKILKDVMRENVARTGLPVTVAPNLDRGGIISGGVQFRFHTLAERLFPLVEDAGLVATVVQDVGGLRVDVRETKAIRRPFSVTSGNLVSYEWAESNPTATSVVAGGQGEGAGRVLLYKQNTTLQNDYGDQIEAFMDARDTDEAAELDARMNETLLEGAPKSGLSLEIANTRGFTYGTHYQVGDFVTVQHGGINIAERLRSARFSWVRDKGFTITPEVGDRADDPDTELYRLVRKLQQKITHLEVR